MRVLVADDDVRLGTLVRTVLEPSGHRVTVVAGVRRTHEALRAAQWDVVLVDVDLTGGGGLEALQVLDDSATDTVIVVTGARTASDPRVRDCLRGVRRGQFLRKPFSVLDLADLLAALGRSQDGPVATPGPPQASSNRRASAVSARADARSRPDAPRDDRPRDNVVAFTTPPAEHVARLPGRAAPKSTGELSSNRAPVPRVVRDEPASVSPPAPLRLGLSAGTKPPIVQTGPPTMPPMGPTPAVDLRNAQTLARLWATRASGAIHASFPDGRTSIVGLAQGGPVSGDAWEVLEALVLGGSMRFDASSALGAGDWHTLGAVLFDAVRRPDNSGFAERHRFHALRSLVSVAVLRALPLPLAAARMLERADGRSPLGELLAAAGVSAGTLGADLHALHTLLLIDFQDDSSSSVSSHLAAPRAARRARLGSTGLRGRTERRAFAAEISAITINSDASDSLQAAAGLAESPTDLGLDARPTLTGGPPSLPGRRSRRAQASSLGDPRALHRRLKAELERLTGAPPAVVLGIPEDAAADLVAQAVERLQRRYQGIFENRGMPRPLRTVARDLGGLVTDAGRCFYDAPTATPVEQRPREELLFEQGQRLVASGNFEQADKVLSRAKDLVLAHPGVLAWLGWARYQNAARPRDARVDEARDLLLLAEQFEPELYDGQLFLARLLMAEGDPAAATSRARRALRARDGDADAQALLREAERKAAALPR